MKANKQILRLDKYLADMGIGSRQEVKNYIRQGRVRVGGNIVRHPEEKVAAGVAEISFDGQKVGYSQFEYFMMNKPAGVITATQDDRERTVLDLIPAKRKKDLFPVGRLDKDTEGLLLITNDGELAHRLLSPRHHADKCYFARVRGAVTEEDIQAFLQGVDIGTIKQPERTLPADLEILSSGEISKIRLTIQEGKFHQVKRMFQAVGKEVLYLKRLSMGALSLDETLQPGEYRTLTDEEVKNTKGKKRDDK